MEESANKHTWLTWAAIATLIVGGGVGIAMLIAPAGVWLGLWPFGTGFQILGRVNPFTGWIALFCLIDGIALAVLAKVLGTDKSTRVFCLALVGALASGIAWYIPTTFQAPEGQQYPPIHDVSTDLINIPQYVAVMPLRADAPNTTVYGGSPNMTPQRNAELQTEAYPDLVTKYYDDSAAEMFERALAAVDEMGWELVAANAADGRIEATATTFWFRFKDDIVIRIQTEGGQSLVDARSLSRVGGGDVGANAKRLRAFFEIL